MKRKDLSPKEEITIEDEAGEDIIIKTEGVFLKIAVEDLLEILKEKENKNIKIMQSKKHSLLESFANVLVGYLVAVASQILIFPFFNIHIPLADNFLIGL